MEGIWSAYIPLVLLMMLPTSETLRRFGSVGKFSTEFEPQLDSFSVVKDLLLALEFLRLVSLVFCL